ncbi:MAG TPA: hypothetical protein EYM48_08215 [Campylobacterales bacterium]|nr:hypothetical protein [Campylobacterales bacterium]
MSENRKEKLEELAKEKVEQAKKAAKDVADKVKNISADEAKEKLETTAGTLKTMIVKNKVISGLIAAFVLLLMTLPYLVSIPFSIVIGVVPGAEAVNLLSFMLFNLDIPIRVAIILNMGIGFLIARYAKSKGRSFIGAFSISIFLSPILAVVFVLFGGKYIRSIYSKVSQATYDAWIVLTLGLGITLYSIIDIFSLIEKYNNAGPIYIKLFGQVGPSGRFNYAPSFSDWGLALIILAVGIASIIISFRVRSNMIQSLLSNVPTLNNTKICPKCAEKVKVEAQICKHCSHEFDV